MKQDKRPLAAIDEAKRKAIAGGFQVIELARPEELAFDFVAERDEVTSLIRVHRLKHDGFRLAAITRSCARKIRELRECTLFKGSERELWVRGPARPFHRFRVLPESIEELGDPGIAPAPAGTGEIQETCPVPWYEKPIPTNDGEVREVPYVQESPVQRERREAMFRGYAKYIAGKHGNDTMAGNPGSVTGDPKAGSGINVRDPDREAVDPV